MPSTIRAWNTSGALFHVHFANAALGPYSRARAAADFGAVSAWDDGLSAGRAQVGADPAAPSGRSLRVRYPAGGVGPKQSGAQFLVPLGARYDELFCAFRLRFDAEFEFVLGGKLPGLVGGAHNTGGGRPTGTDGFSARVMWREHGAIVQYVYHPDQAGVWGEDLPYRQGDPSDGASSAPLARFEPGRWHDLEHRVVMNTPGRHDGLVEAWLDGRPVLHRPDLRFREDASFAIDACYFSTFFGGNSAEWAPGRDQFVSFAELAVAPHALTH